MMSKSATLRRENGAAEADWRQAAYQPLAMAGKIAGVSVGSLYRAESDGKLSFVRLAGRTLVTTESLKSFIGSAKPWTPSERGKEARAKRSERSRAAWQS